MLQDWQEKMLDAYLLDKQKWAQHAVQEKVYLDEELALLDKSIKCTKRKLEEHIATNGEFEAGLTIQQKVDVITSAPDYKNRVAIEAEAAAQREAEELAAEAARVAAAAQAEEEFQTKVDEAVVAALASQ